MTKKPKTTGAEFERRSRASRLGWERRKQEELLSPDYALSQKYLRSHAAKKGWETRRKNIAQAYGFSDYMEYQEAKLFILQLKLRIEGVFRGQVADYITELIDEQISEYELKDYYSYLKEQEAGISQYLDGSETDKYRIKKNAIGIALSVSVGYVDEPRRMEIEELVEQEYADYE